MTERHHMMQSVDGPLANWSDEEWEDACDWFEPTFVSGAGLKAEFKRLQSEGIKVLPVGDCENFDYIKGCLGHPVYEQERAGIPI